MTIDGIISFLIGFVITIICAAIAVFSSIIAHEDKKTKYDDRDDD